MVFPNQDGLRQSPKAGVHSFLPLWLACFRTTVVARFYELTGKMERLIDKFYFDTSSLGELRDEPLWDELLLRQVNLILDTSFVRHLDGGGGIDAAPPLGLPS